MFILCVVHLVVLQRICGGPMIRSKICQNRKVKMKQRVSHLTWCIQFKMSDNTDNSHNSWCQKHTWKCVCLSCHRINQCKIYARRKEQKWDELFIVPGDQKLSRHSRALCSSLWTIRAGNNVFWTGSTDWEWQLLPARLFQQWVNLSLVWNDKHTHNSRIWGSENPHVSHKSKRDSSKLNVWNGAHPISTPGDRSFLPPRGDDS
jgi:hypothetical protein